QLEVAHFLRRAMAREIDVRKRGRRERILLRMERRHVAAQGAGGNRVRERAGGCRRERGERAFDPLRGRVVVIDVAVDARMRAFGAERLEARVEIAPGLAEVLVTRIA